MRQAMTSAMLSADCQFALGGDGGEQPRGVPAVALGVEQAADDRAPRRVGGQLAPAVLAERSDGGRAVPGVGVLVGGVQVAGHERGQRPGFLLRGGDGLGGRQRRALGARGC